MTDSADNRHCCAPGDITVSLVHSGFLIGRVMPPIGVGPWWQYIRVVLSRQEAFDIAKELAAHYRGKAWFQIHDRYELIE
jgi:hypothetical protein